jgi:hypothetical protein
LKTHLAAEKVATVLQTSLDQSPHVTSEQESHHSVRDVYAHFHHGSRDSLPLAAPTLKTKIKLPRANERKSWQHINDEIERAGATQLSSEVLRSEPLDEVVANLHRIVRSTLEQFSPPVTDELAFRSDGPQPLLHRMCQFRARLRSEKRVLRKECKTLRKQCSTNPSLAQRLQIQAQNKLWRTLCKQHNTVRKQEAQAAETQTRRQTQSRFFQNPHTFAQKLFKPTSSSSPTFNRDTAETFFRNTYNDAERNWIFHNSLNLPPTAEPTVPFNRAPVTWNELYCITSRKRNASTPGENGNGYMVYKKCPAALDLLLKIINRVLTSRLHPRLWSVAVMILLFKSGKTDDPANFRNIALTNVEGKLFWSVIGKRIMSFALANKFLPNTIQKGFVDGVPGCLDHTDMVFSAFKNAKQYHRSICCAWLDFKNAYGNVKHNLIQFALKRYHIPLEIAEIIFEYYEQLEAVISTKDWSTGIVPYLIGVFQGCVLSVYLFLLVFQLLLDYLELHHHDGYLFSADTNTSAETAIHIRNPAFADDLTAVSSSPSGNQLVINRVEIFCRFSRSWALHPGKCISVALAYQQGADGAMSFQPFDPKLTIKDVPIPFLGDKSFKFLGRQIYASLSEQDQASQVETRLVKQLQDIDCLLLSGPSKAWLYQHYIVAFTTWPFMVYNFPLTFASELTAIATRYLKKWYGLALPAEISILYRSRSKHGLNLTSLTAHYKAMRVCKAHLFKHSSDPAIRQLYQLKLNKARLSTKKWAPETALEEAEAEVELECKFPGQTTRHGIGFARSRGIQLCKTSTIRDHRAVVMAKMRTIAEDQSLVRVYSLAIGGNWMKLQELMQHDLSWQAQLHSIPEARLKFLLNSIQLSLPTPSNLRLWGKSSSGRCALCGYRNATLLHILAGCERSLKRFTWRHNLVLYILLKHICGRLKDHNRNHDPTRQRPSIQFVREGESKRRQPPKNNNRHSLLDGAVDWEFLLDLPEVPLIVPPFIIDTPLRPDLIIWSRRTKTVIFGELTCPWEENITKANQRKNLRYSELADLVRLAGWTVHLLPFEVGCRGFVAISFRKLLSKIAFPPRQTSDIVKRVSLTTLQASYIIYKARHGHQWHEFDLVERPSLNLLRHIFCTLRSDE